MAKSAKKSGRGRGRPKSGVTPKRYFRCPDEEWEQIRQAAEIRGTDISKYIRSVMSKSANAVIKNNKE